MVINLKEYRGREHAAVLKELHDQALRGEISGLILAVKFAYGTPEIVSTGDYRSDAWAAMQMASRIWFETHSHITQLL